MLTMALYPLSCCDVLHVAIPASNFVSVGIQCGGDQSGGTTRGRSFGVIFILIQLFGIRKITEQISEQCFLIFCHGATAFQYLHPLSRRNIFHIPACAAGLDISALLNQPDHGSVPALLIFQRILKFNLSVDLFNFLDAPSPHLFQSVQLDINI